MASNQIQFLLRSGTALALGLALWTHAAAAQRLVSNRGALSGTILTASTGEPVGFAVVTLVPQATGLFPTGAGRAGFLSANRSVYSDRRGLYRFSEILAGTYRLHVRRIGFRPATIDLDLEGREGLRLSVGLVMVPIKLEPLIARSIPADLYSAGAQPDDDETWNRVARERWRQENFLTSDVRMISQEDVAESVTLGETDILRALQRVPGVSTRDDWTAGLWIRGAPAGHTRVYFDGVPLYNPFHAGGLSTAVNADGLGVVFLHPGVRPAHMGSGAAGMVDMKSRSAGGQGELRGRLQALSSSVSAEVDRRWADGRIGTLLAGRRSWLGRTRNLVNGTEGTSLEIPNDFADVMGRVDVDLGSGSSLEVSGIWERDWINGALEGGPAGNTSTWGTFAGRATVQTLFQGGVMRHTAGISRFDATVRQIEPQTPLAAFAQLPTQEPTENDVLYRSLTGDWTKSDQSDLGGGPRWRLGYKLSLQRIRYRGAPPTPFSIPVYLYTADIDGSANSFQISGERWFRPSERWTVRVGVRLRFSIESVGTTSDTNGDDIITVTGSDIEPQVSVRYRASQRLTLTGAKGSTFQSEQAIAPSGLLFGPALSVSPVWILSPSVLTGINTDITTLGLEYWLSDAWLASINYYERVASGLAIPDPTPGTTDDDAFTVPARNKANGLEFSARRLAGRWTGSLAYSLGASNYRSVGLDFPAPSDRRHLIDATWMVKLSDRISRGTLRAGGTFSAASGAPFTRYHPGWYDCSEYEIGGGCQPIVQNLVEEPNAERSPWAVGFNVLFDWIRSFDGMSLGVHLQVQNLLNSPRSVTYVVDDSVCRRKTLDSAFCGSEQDAFVPGLRRHYELGLRVAF